MLKCCSMMILLTACVRADVRVRCDKWAKDWLYKRFNSNNTSSAGSSLPLAIK